jgi:hypothetical protein
LRKAGEPWLAAAQGRHSRGGQRIAEARVTPR